MASASDSSFVRVLIVAVIAGSERHASRAHDFLGFRFRAHGADGADRRPDEDDPRLVAGAAEGLVFREEAIAGMNGLGAGLPGRGDDFFADQIGLPRRRRADANGLIGETDMARPGVGLGKHRDRANAHAPGGLDDAAGDFAAIGDQDFVEHVVIRSGPVRRAFVEEGGEALPSLPARAKGGNAARRLLRKRIVYRSVRPDRGSAPWRRPAPAVRRRAGLRPGSPRSGPDRPPPPPHGRGRFPARLRASMRSAVRK